jgi:hypothetical protein
VIGIENKLSLFAELGLGYAGFLAIFLIFTRQQEHFSAADSLRVRAIILASFTVVLASLLPLVVVEFVASSQILWRIVGGVMLIWYINVCVNIGIHESAMTDVERADVGAFNNVFSWFNGILSNVLFLVCIFHDNSEPWYLAALFSILIIGTSNFITIAFHRLL